MLLHKFLPFRPWTLETIIASSSQKLALIDRACSQSVPGGCIQADEQYKKRDLNAPSGVGLVVVVKLLALPSSFEGLSILREACPSGMKGASRS